jgi:hypothetical protein
MLKNYMSILPLALLIFWFIFFISGKLKIKNLMDKHISSDEQKLMMDVVYRNLRFSSIVLIIACCIDATDAIFPVQFNRYFPEFPFSASVEEMGDIIIKLSFAWLFYSIYQNSNVIDSEISELSFYRIYKIETTSITPVTVLNLGLFMMIPGLPTLLILLICLARLVFHYRKLRFYRINKWF